jgi:hypothetical protein
MAPNERVLSPDRLSRLTPTLVIQSAIATLTVELRVSLFRFHPVSRAYMISLQVGGDLCLCHITISEQLLLVVQ